VTALLAPFPYFGGKRSIASEVWRRLGTPKQYIEPFCGSAAVLLAAPEAASLEVVNDANGFIANFWRAVVHQPGEVAHWADYPVSRIDLGARHRWLMDQRTRIGEALQDPDWGGDAKVAGWWLWGQCCWIGSGWCDWDRPDSARLRRGARRPGDGPDSARRKRGRSRVPDLRRSRRMGVAQ
jgi:DNA adenine methylase